MKVVRHWNTLPGEIVDAPCLKVSKASYEMALSKLTWWEDVPALHDFVDRVLRHQ